MKPINEIRALFNVIKTETRRWFNTGARIDEVGQEILDHIEYLEQQAPSATSHPALNDKNAEPNFQHVDTTITKEVLSEDDKVTIFDSETGNIVLTNKNNVGGTANKILDTVVSTWTASTTYVKYPYEAVILIENLKESDSVEVIYSIPDAESTNYAPGGELYEGYIKIFAKVNTTITVPTLVITKIDL